MGPSLLKGPLVISLWGAAEPGSVRADVHCIEGDQRLRHSSRDGCLDISRARRSNGQ
jgi:hypothetical protein